MGALANYGIANIWCAPTQDRPYILRLARVSTNAGMTNTWQLLFESGSLPQQGKKFHLFQVGLLFPAMLNLPTPEQGQWIKFTDLCNHNKLFADLYLDTGIRLNLSQAYFTVTFDRNLIIAIEHNTKYGWALDYQATEVDLNHAFVYLRVYSNQYYNSSRWADKQTQYGGPITQPVYTQGVVNATLQQILDLQLVYQQYAAMPGHVFAYKNGYVVPNISLVTCAVGDTIEMIYDASVERVVRQMLTDIPMFNSVVDQAGKYIIHTPKPNDNRINYHDDVDFAFINTVNGLGVYLHKNLRYGCKMLTHCDYSIPVSTVTSLMMNNQLAFSPVNEAIEYYIRAAGFDRSLVNEGSRLSQLYKLDDSAILAAMTGVDSVIPVWSAAQLETSAYTQLMSTDYSGVNDGLVADALGYHAAAKLLGEPAKILGVGNNSNLVDVPALYSQDDFTVFEYDADGLLLGYYYVTNHASIYAAVNVNTHHVDFVKGSCSQAIADSLNTATVEIPIGADWRAYIRQKSTNPQANLWVDVTANADNCYTLSNGTLTWNNATRLSYDTLVRNNSKALLIDTQIPHDSSGLMVTHLTTWRTVNGVTALYDLDIPMGELDVWLNGHALVKGIDYQVDFPVVYIHNKTYYNAAGSQHVVVRMKGLCNTQLQMTEIAETGFVQGGMLSADHRFQVRDDKVTQLVVAGGLRLASDFAYSENNPAAENKFALNGQYYQIKDYVVPLRGATGQDTYSYYAQARAVETQVNNYLTTRLPMADVVPAPATNRPILFSAFFSKLIDDLATGAFDATRLTSNYTSTQIEQWLLPYKYLLDHDPVKLSLRPDLDYIQLDLKADPGVAQLTIYTYQFLQRVAALIAPDIATPSVIDSYVTYPAVN